MDFVEILDLVQQVRFLALEKALLMGADLEAGYLGKNAIKTPAEQAWLVEGYRENQTKFFILQDYMRQAGRLLLEAERTLEAQTPPPKIRTKPTDKPPGAQAALVALVEGLSQEDQELLHRLASCLQERRKEAPA